MLMDQYKQILPQLNVCVLPAYSTSLYGIYKNIRFVLKNKAKYNWIYSIGDGYLSLFLKNTTITIHDLDSIENLNLFSKLFLQILCILIPAIKKNKYHCISDYTRNKFLKYLPFKKKNTFVIYNPVNPIYMSDKNKYLSEGKFYNNKITILQIGTGIRKNLESLIEAVSQLDNINLLIVGKLSTLQMKLLSDLNIKYENYVDIDNPTIKNLYNRADIISFPSNCEGFGMIIIEANAMGKPVIAGDIPVLHEIGQNAALYVIPGCVTDLKDKIIQLSKNKELRKKMIKAGYDNVKRFNLEQLSYQLYDKIKE